MSWLEAITKVLEESGEAMRYTDIADKIQEKKYKTKFGATPAATVNVTITSDINQHGIRSRFERVSKGNYRLLRRKSDSTAEMANAGLKTSDMDQETKFHICAYGMYWEREMVTWKGKFALNGKQLAKADSVDFYDQRGIYLLHDGTRTIYVGQAVDQPLGKRLCDHTIDRLKGRWNRFSWFGVRQVTDKGELGSLESVDPRIIDAFEAILIESLEPPQNKRQGENMADIEYIQGDDLEIARKLKKQFLAEMSEKI